MVTAYTTGLISVVVPAYNEGPGISRTYRVLTEVMTETGRPYELLFIDDGSSDDTAEILRGHADADGHVRLIEFSRNFGKEVALTAGMHAAHGDAVITLDADLQHPPHHIPRFLAEWDKGAEVVVGVREGGAGQSPAKRASSFLYYRIINSIADREVRPGSTDFRLLDRQVVDAFTGFTERNRITRGLVDWLGFRRTYVTFTADVRAAGKATYSLSKLVHLALDSFVSTSLFPLRVAGYLGVFITVVAAISATIVGVDSYVFNDPLHEKFTGTAILAIVIVFLVGIILSCLGLIALYIANIHTEVINRPLYVVRRARATPMTPATKSIGSPTPTVSSAKADVPSRN